jgi:hypothetical protein
MTKKELSINIKWDEFEMGTCRVFVPVLNQYIPLVFFQDHKPKPTVSNKMLASVNDILGMEEDEFSRLEDILAIETYKIKEIHIDQDNDVYEGVHSEVIVSTGTHERVSVVVKDARFMFVHDGTYFDTLAVSEKEPETKGMSKEHREQIVAKMMESE